MFGGLAVRNQLVCHGYSDTRGRIRLLSAATGALQREWVFRGEGEGFAEVGGLCLDRDSNVYVADPEGGVIRRFSLFGTPLGRLGTPGTGRGARHFRDARGVLHHPNDVVLDEEGNLYVCCGDRPMRHAVQSFTPSGKYRFSFRAFGEPLEEWGLPMGIAVAEDKLYVADTFNQCVQVFFLDGTFQMMFSTCPGPGERSLPVAVGVRPDGNILVAQWKEHPALLMFNPSGWFLGEVLSPGEEEGKVFAPAALDLDGEGGLFLLDRAGERVQRFDGDMELRWSVTAAEKEA